MGKGEIARYEQFLLFPQYFQKACFPGNWLNAFVYFSSLCCVNLLPNEKYLAWCKFKAFSDDTVSVIERLKFVLRQVENSKCD